MIWGYHYFWKHPYVTIFEGEKFWGGPIWTFVYVCITFPEKKQTILLGFYMVKNLGPFFFDSLWLKEMILFWNIQDIQVWCVFPDERNIKQPKSNLHINSTLRYDVPVTNPFTPKQTHAMTVPPHRENWQ